jgi:endonuclease YncB( thermonuclease family)
MSPKRTSRKPMREISAAAAILILSAWMTSAVLEKATSAPEQNQSTRVVAVTDGDTLKVLSSHNIQTTIRLEGIDAPEKGQAYGQRAKQTLAALCFGKEVQVLPKTKDRYGRTVARIICQGKDMSTEMIRAGLAWHYTKYSKDPTLADEEKRAKNRRVGLWSSSNPIPPWEQRK